MLLSTFRHIRGISARKEIQFWSEGVLTWDDLEGRLNPQYSLFRESAKPAAPLEALRLSKQALQSGNANFFAQHLERQEHYRIACSFPYETLFLDIETTGLSRYYDYITLVGWSMGGTYDLYVKGGSDKKLREALSCAKAIVTFNGSIFDLPFLQQEFHGISFPMAHVDLRFLSRRAGLSGGQKAIEAKLGFQRTSDIRALSGEAAPVLWHRYRRGDLKALSLLVEYNHADIEGMKAILDHVVTTLAQKQNWPASIDGIKNFSDVRSKLVWENETRLSGGTELSPYSGSAQPLITIDDLILTDRDPRLCVVGIDLSGSEARQSGWCVLEGRSASTKMLATDNEIISETLKAQPHVISIDSPLSLPTGRTRVDDSDPAREEHGIMRHCERLLKRRGVNVYPALIPSMQKLTARGIRLAAIFRKHGIPVVESYPGAAQDIMNIPRKRASLEFLESGLAEFGIEGNFLIDPVTHDELDAITSAIVGVFFWSGKFERLGTDALGDEALIIPYLQADPTEWRTRVVLAISGAIAAGKTAAAHYFVKCGCTYSGYSEKIRDIASPPAKNVTRQLLQKAQQALAKNKGQRWIVRELLQSLPIQQNLVIDGITSAEDHAFLAEVFGPAFFHIHISASADVRQERYNPRDRSARTFRRIDSHSVERQVNALSKIAHAVIENDDELPALYSRLSSILLSK